jgi:hypothetical protein
VEELGVRVWAGGFSNVGSIVEDALLEAGARVGAASVPGWMAAGWQAEVAVVVAVAVAPAVRVVQLDYLQPAELLPNRLLSPTFVPCTPAPFADAEEVDFEGFLKMLRVGSYDSLDALDQVRCACCASPPVLHAWWWLRIVAM